MTAPHHIGVQRTAPCGLAAEAGSLGVGSKLFLLFATVALSSSCATTAKALRGEDYVVYSRGDCRVYLSASFKQGFMFVGASAREDSLKSYKATLEELGPLFDRGALTGDMFRSLIKHSNIPIRNLSQRPAASVDDLLFNDPGPLMKVLFYRNVSDPEAPTRRRFDLWITFTREESGWGGFHHYTLEVENQSGTGDMAPHDFMAHAKVTSLAYEGLRFERYAQHLVAADVAPFARRR